MNKCLDRYFSPISVPARKTRPRRPSGLIHGKCVDGKKGCKSDGECGAGEFCYNGTLFYLRQT